MSLANQVINRPVTEDLPSIEAILNYLIPMAEKPVNYTYEPPPGIPPQNGSYEAIKLPICNGRAIAPNLSLDREGFAFIPHSSNVRDFYDENEVYNLYYPEAERLLLEVTSAAKVVVFDYNVRNIQKAQKGENGAKEPVQESPLAVCDAQSIAVADWVASDLVVYRDRVGETYAVTYNSAHRWFYFPQMRSHEVLLIKCFDSAQDGKARFTAIPLLTILPVHQMRLPVKALNCEH